MAGATTSGELRAHNRVRLLRAVHDCGASRTRSQLTRELDLARGTASVLVGGLVEDALLHEEPHEAHGRGRPTQVPGPHPQGPLALAVDLREDAWEIAACELGGRATTLETDRHDGTPSGALGPVGAALRRHLSGLAGRAVGVGLSIAGPVRQGSVVDIAHLDWQDVDVAALLALSSPETSMSRPPGADSGVGGVALFVGNDARLAGLAEARRGRLQGVSVGLHLHVDFDLGGTLLIDGRPLAGATGTAGEFGHMPIATAGTTTVTAGTSPGASADRCMCGAPGCWSLLVGGNALLRAFGHEAGYGRGRDQAEHILALSAQGEAAAVEAVAANARALGAGTSALVNALDPAVVTLSGMGVLLHEQAEAVLMQAYTEGLMTFRRPSPALIAPSALGQRGPLIGAMESVFDAFLTTEGLENWRAGR